jgi:cytochrome c biogenesis protein CcmG/thiol:disulfide interchange protein DsbE
LFIGAVIAAALGIGLFTGVGTRSASGRPVAGAEVPSFSLPRLGGAGVVAVPATGGGNGKPAILLFFASWCSPCQAEVPAVARTYRRQERDGSRLAKVVLIGVDVSDPKVNALAFMHESGVTFPVGADASSTVTNGVFQFTGLPDAVFVEGNGKIAAIHRGALTSSGLVLWEKKLLETAG